MGIIKNIVSTIIGISLLIFSSYKGNNPKVTDFSYIFSNSYLQIHFKLKDAFDSDFKDFFKSTLPIRIIFKLTLSGDNNKIFYSKKYIYAIQYNPFLKQYDFSIEGEKYTTSSYQYLLNKISEFNFRIKIKQIRLYKLKIVVYPEPIFIQNRKFDLKLLWKNKIIIIKQNLIPGLYEN